MTRRNRYCLLALGLASCAIAAGHAPTAGANEPVIEGYRSYDALRRELQAIAGDEAATLESLGTTLGGRDVYLLTLSIGEANSKPAILVMGSVHAPHAAGAELAVRMARRLVEAAKSDEKVRLLLQEQTIYVIPLPSPDASEAFFHKPYWERTGNARATDDDRDGRTNEDGPEDLNGDGRITMMRIEDPTGPYMPHPDDPRALIEADAKKGEQGRYRMEIESIDNDKDELQAEDGPGGVAFDRNFTFKYPYFQPGAGPHQVSEPETRAVADFAFDHPNIYLVFSFSPHDNLMHPWKAQQQSGSIPTSVHRDDVPYLDEIAKAYQDAIQAKDAPTSLGEEGSFVHWAYFHYGRWSLATRGWWIPKVSENKVSEKRPDAEQQENESQAEDESESNDSEEDASDDEQPDENADNAQQESSEKETSGEKRRGEEKRGADDVNALRWFEQQGVEGFAPWKQVDHPDYPNRRVEIGGFYPYVRLNPPAGELDKLAEVHTQFLADLAERRAKLAITFDKVEDFGGGLYRLVVEVRNDGYLPTESAMGARAQALQRLQLQIELPEGAVLVNGVKRASVGRLAGHGGAEKYEWLLRCPPETSSKTIKITAGSPTAGTVEATTDLP